MALIKPLHSELILYYGQLKRHQDTPDRAHHIGIILKVTTPIVSLTLFIDFKNTQPSLVHLRFEIGIVHLVNLLIVFSLVRLIMFALSLWIYIDG